jgi:extracellular elastinolytic metalloproteinase
MRLRSFVPAVVGAVTLMSAGSAMADDVGSAPGLPDFDVRGGKLAPTAVQKADVKVLQASVAWNQFGTPSSLVRPSGSLATVDGSSAVDAARAWLGRNRTLFRQGSVAGLELVSDSKLAGSDGHAVTLRQAPGGLDAAGGGLVTIGLTKAGGAWKVVSASSTLSGDQTIASGGAKLNLGQAWQRAARSVGRSTSLARITRVSSRKAGIARGWSALRVAGLQNVQQARKVAFPTISKGYIPAYETLVVDTSGSEPSAYRVYVDAQSGAVLARENLVDSDGVTDSSTATARAPKARAAQAAAQPPTPFSGTLPPTDGACDDLKGPFTVTADSGVRAIDVFANADVPTNDIILKFFRGTELLLEEDTGTTPEGGRYQPVGGVPAGDYTVQVCEFADGTPPRDPRTYSGTVGFDTSPAYLARWKAFAANPPLNPFAADPWNNPSTDTRDNWCWRAGSNPGDCTRVIGSLASRSPWDVDGKTNTPSGTTTGNNATTSEDWPNPFGPTPNRFRPTSDARDYSFPWTNEWFTSDCNPGNPYGSAFTVGKSFDIPAAVTNLFVMHNRMHDFSYNLGFTEENFNAQSSNFGLTDATRENDPVIGDAQAGATSAPPGVYANARNNANMTTLPDGNSSFSNMYLWQPVAGAFYPPCVDGDYDAGVIGHEYTHMIENRMIGKGGGRAGFQAGAMGEAAGDLVSIEQLNENGFVPTDGENPFATGTYATGNKLRGIRNYAANFPSQGAFPEPGVYPQVDPLNFSDIGYDVTGPEVHADGEIWVAINFEIRKALAAKYNAQFPESDRSLQAQCAAGALPVTQCPGNRRWIQLLFDAFLFMPQKPSMVDARNAILAADQARFGGADQAELWNAFARRGLGRFASQTTGTGRANGVESDQDPLPDFEAQGQPNATVTFEARSAAGGDAPKARIYVGHYEARVSPIADTDATTNEPATATANNLDQTAVFAPGAYEFIATAPGFGAVRFRQTFTANNRKTVKIEMAPNLASTSAGATATGNVTPITVGTTTVQDSARVLRNLIDDTEDTQWQAAATQGADGSFNVAGNQVTVDLAGTQAQRINRVNVSAMLGPVFVPSAGADATENRFTALRKFEIWTCNAQVADCSQQSSFQRAFVSGDDAFPADAPRPVAPMLLMRSFAFSAVRATHLRIVVDSSQCTDGPAYQGEQDNDPFNATDCNSAGPASTRAVRIAELQAFSAASRVQ